jgi:hypothetical protein
MYIQNPHCVLWSNILPPLNGKPLHGESVLTLTLVSDTIGLLEEQTWFALLQSHIREKPFGAIPVFYTLIIVFGLAYYTTFKG